MTAYFFNRKDATYRKFKNVEQLKFGYEVINGRPTPIIYVCLPDETVTLKRSEYELELVQQ